VLVNLTDAYSSPTSHLRRTIACLNTSGTGTNLKTPLEAAANHLSTAGRANADKILVFMTDGAPNYNSAGQQADHTCGAAFQAAAAAKTSGIEMYTIAYGLGSVRCPTLAQNPFEDPAWANRFVEDLLQAMASSPAHAFRPSTPSQLTGVLGDIGAAIVGNISIVE
jgi:hypothetical protein